jgi:hypothetical protein
MNMSKFESMSIDELEQYSIDLKLGTIGKGKEFATILDERQAIKVARAAKITDHAIVQKAANFSTDEKKALMKKWHEEMGIKDSGPVVTEPPVAVMKKTTSIPVVL